MQQPADETSGWATWTPAERESFFAAIARHRRAAWRVTLASRAGNLVVTLIVAILMAPLFYAALAFALDLVNLVIPTPNIIPGIMNAYMKVVDAPGKISMAAWIGMAVLTALPGLIWMAFILNALRRVLRTCMTLDAGELSARPPEATVLAEQRFANVVSEMAIAANLPAPRVLIAGSDVIDAVAFGVDAQHATIVISQGLLATLNRAQMEGVAADLVASIANGDMSIGVRAALSTSLFALIALLATMVTQTHVRRNLGRIARTLLLPTTDRARQLVLDLSSPFEGEKGEPAPPPAPLSTPQPGLGGELRARWGKIRPYLWLPLAGPLVMTGFFGGIVNLFILGPLLSLAWRQRKYMADATAVRLTRDPDTLAGALEKMNEGSSTALAPWAAHMSIVGHGVVQRGVFGSSVPMFPSIDRRLHALGGMGAHVTRAPRKMPLRIVLIIAPLLAIVAVLVAIMLPLLIWLSLALTMLFGGIPFGILHSLLRWLGHH